MPGISEDLLRIGIGLSIVAVVVLVVVKLLWSRPKKERKPDELPEIDLSVLMYDPKATARCRLELYHIPMQLAAIVVAPAGRDRNVPFDEELPEILDQLSPGFGNAYTQHNPKVFHWPAQLSSEGFVRTFFSHARLPGQHGKGSEWTSVCGRLETNDYSLLIGLLLRSQEKNNLGQLSIERPTQWLDMFRVRRD